MNLPWIKEFLDYYNNYEPKKGTQKGSKVVNNWSSLSVGTDMQQHACANHAKTTTYAGSVVKIVVEVATQL